MTGLRPSSAGGDQPMFADPSPELAVTPVGAPGTAGPPGMTGCVGAEACPVPMAVVAVTVNVYGTPSVSPSTTAWVDDPSTSTLTPSGDDVTVYPVIGLPPFAGGTDHSTVAEPSPAAAIASTGAPGFAYSSGMMIGCGTQSSRSRVRSARSRSAYAGSRATFVSSYGSASTS